MKKLLIGFAIVFGGMFFVDSPRLAHANDEVDSPEMDGGSGGCITGRVNDATCRSGYPACGFIMAQEQAKNCNYSLSIGA